MIIIQQLSSKLYIEIISLIRSQIEMQVNELINIIISVRAAVETVYISESITNQRSVSENIWLAESVRRTKLLNFICEEQKLHRERSAVVIQQLTLSKFRNVSR